jgi:hypothetical protein
MADRLLKGTDNSPSSTARPGASPPSDVLLLAGQRGHLPGVQSHHDYSWRLQTLAPNGSAPHLESLVSGRLLPGLTLATLLSGHHGGSSAGYLRRLGGCSGSSLGLRCQGFNGHHLRDGASFGFGPCQQKTFELVSHSGYDYSSSTTAFVQCTHPLQC